MLENEMPPGCDQVWGAFNSLGSPSTSGSFQPITAQEIQAWQSMHGIKLSPWELDAIRAIDKIAAECSTKYKAKSKP
jgi:hypothetical protein